MKTNFLSACPAEASKFIEGGRVICYFLTKYSHNFTNINTTCAKTYPAFPDATLAIIPSQKATDFLINNNVLGKDQWVKHSFRLVLAYILKRKVQIKSSWSFMFSNSIQALWYNHLLYNISIKTRTSLFEVFAFFLWGFCKMQVSVRILFVKFWDIDGEENVKIFGDIV